MGGVLPFFGSLNPGKLEECSYITSKKAFVDLRPKTTYRITAAGRRALANTLQSMKSLIAYLEGANGKVTSSAAPSGSA